MEVNRNFSGIRFRSWIQFVSAVAVIILIALATSLVRLRLDLTEDDRYTLSPPTRKVLSGLKNDIYIQVYLDGDIPIPLKRLRRSVREMLDEFRITSGRKIDFDFINPSESSNQGEREKQYQSLVNKGLNPVNLQAGDAEGGSTQKIIFPGMIVNYNGIEVPINFLNNSSGSYEQNILRSMEGLEYEVIQTISTVSKDTIFKVAFLEGHGEIPEIETADITMNLARYFTVDRGIIGGKQGILDKYAAIVVAGPEKEFTEADKLVLDQYIMNGGKVLWLVDEVKVNTDSLTLGSTIGLFRPLNIEDQLFRYGARVNPVIVQDLDSWVIRVNIGSGNAQQKFVALPWLYYPLLIPSSSHPIARNINRVKGDYSNYIDTVGLDMAIHKTILLHTSAFSRVLSPPLIISLKEAEKTPSEKEFPMSSLPVAVLLEGVFPSVFKNRSIDNYVGAGNLKIKTESTKTKMIVIADADIIRNEVTRSGLQEVPVPLGVDKYTGQTFGNRDFLINCLNYLVDDDGLMELRSREIKLRLLDKARIKSEKLRWQLINVLGPVLVVILSGLAYGWFRKRKYTSI
jgi:gliding-associated putative ABC transporter substrate-binding component GldG